MTTRTTGPGRGTQVLREANRGQVIDLLQTAGPMARSEVADRLGLTRSAVTAIVAELIELGTLREVPDPPSGPARPGGAPVRGRPRTLVGLDPDAARVVAVQIGARWARVVLADATGATIATDSVGIRGAAPGEVVERVAVLAEELAGRHPGPPVTNVGVCVPGAVDTGRGTVLRSDVLGWTDIPLAAQLSERMGIPVSAQDVTQAATLAEARFGAAVGARDALVIDYGARIGVGLVVDGNLHRGASGLAGAIGHTAVAGATAPCRCGRIGCLEAVAGARAMVTSTGRSDADAVDAVDAGDGSAAFADVIARFRAGEPAATDVVLLVLDRAAHLVASLIALVDPEVVVLTGMVVEYPELAEVLADRVRATVPAELRSSLDIRSSDLGLQAWVQGAILVALQQLHPEVRGDLVGRVPLSEGSVQR